MNDIFGKKLIWTFIDLSSQSSAFDLEVIWSYILLKTKFLPWVLRYWGCNVSILQFSSFVWVGKSYFGKRFIADDGFTFKATQRWILLKNWSFTLREWKLFRSKKTILIWRYVKIFFKSNILEKRSEKLKIKHLNCLSEKRKDGEKIHEWRMLFLKWLLKDQSPSFWLETLQTRRPFYDIPKNVNVFFNFAQLSTEVFFPSPSKSERFSVGNPTWIKGNNLDRINAFSPY